MTYENCGMIVWFQARIINIYWQSHAMIYDKKASKRCFDDNANGHW